MNIDAGTMAPTEHGQSVLSFTAVPEKLSQYLQETVLKVFDHPLRLARFTGEVFVLDDGGEADLDLGNYERYLDVTLSKDNNITTGKIYQHVIEKEVSPVYGQVKQCKTDTRDYSAKVTTSEKPCRLFPTSLELFKTGSRGSLEFLPTRLERRQMSVLSRCVLQERKHFRGYEG